MKKPRIIWTRQALDSVRDIYLFYKEKSPQSARKLKKDLLQSPPAIYFSKQYQVDDINSAYRRIVVRNYKILYKIKGDTFKSSMFLMRGKHRRSCAINEFAP